MYNVIIEENPSDKDKKDILNLFEKYFEDYRTWMASEYFLTYRIWFMIIINNKIVGVCSIEDGYNGLYLCNLVVDEKFRRKNFATILVKQVLSTCKEYKNLNQSNFFTKIFSFVKNILGMQKDTLNITAEAKKDGYSSRIFSKLGFENLGESCDNTEYNLYRYKV